MNLGIYIHLPYCLTKCPYCDFNSYGVGTEFPEEEYTKAILSEIDIQGNVLKIGNVSSVFFGGGTPSLFKPSNIKKILEKLDTHYEINKNAEITLEINPRTVELEKLKQFLKAGVNRASIGIQSFSERKLKFYGRNSTSRDGRKVLEDVINAGFKNFNIDLIYGSSNETIDELRNDLEISLGFGSTHLSAYCLTIEDGTQFGYLYKKGMLKLPEDKVLSEMYFITSEVLEKNGFFHYEISNFTKPGNECVQNLNYWNCDTYIGFGAGAHSHLKGYGVSGDWGKRWGNIKNPGRYMKMTAEKKIPSEFVETLERESSLFDWVMMGLRLSGGIEMDIMKQIYNAELDYNKIEYLFNDGMLNMDNGNLKITRKGRIYSNLLIGKVTDSINLLN
jgi:oxygen-independent coproporphyrinogen-3 oxidase